MSTTPRFEARDGAAVRAGGLGRAFPVVCGLIFFAFYNTDHAFDFSLEEGFITDVAFMTENAAGGSLARQLSFLTLASVGLYGLTTGTRRFRLAHVGLPLLVLFAAWAGASVLWSHVPVTTAKRLAVWAFLSLGAVGVARLFRPRDVVRMAVVVTGLVAAVGLLAECRFGTFRPWDAAHRFSGTLHPNHQAIHLVTLSVASAVLWRTSSRRAWLLTAGCVGFGLLLLTRSRTALAGVLLAFATLSTLSAGYRWKVPAALAGLTTVSGLLLFATLSGVDFGDGLKQAATLGRDKQVGTLTGRLPIWESVWPYFAERPWLGWGHDSFWTPGHVAAVSEEVQWGIRESHSAYVDTALSTGLVGLAIAVTALLAFFAVAATRYARAARPADGFVTGMLLFAAVSSSTESAMSMPGFVPFALLAAMLSGCSADGDPAATAATGTADATGTAKPR